MLFRSKERENYWRLKFNEWKGSKLSQSKFCESNDIKKSSFGYWVKRFEKEESNNNDNFVELPVSIIKTKEIEIVINNRIKINIPDNFNIETLKKVFLSMDIKI